MQPGPVQGPIGGPPLYSCQPDSLSLRMQASSQCLCSVSRFIMQRAYVEEEKEEEDKRQRCPCAALARFIYLGTVFVDLKFQRMRIRDLKAKFLFGVFPS